MTKNNQISILQVNKGFIVNEIADRNMGILADSTTVLRTMAELCVFLEDHFDHRAKNILDD